MLPHLDQSTNAKIPYSGVTLQNGFVLLLKCDQDPKMILDGEGLTIASFLDQNDHIPKVQCWACLHLSNGQVAHSEYTKLEHLFDKVCMAWNVKTSLIRLH